MGPTTPPLLPNIVADICVHANALDEIRLGKFLDWLQAHHRADKPIQAQGLPAYLETWLTSLSPAGMLWEVFLLLDEIAWWRGLDEEKLFRFSKGSC
jgi:hypothetical protein